MKLKRKDLIERLADFSVKEDGLTFLAAKILAYIIFSGKKGVTFNQLLEEFGVSKSTISGYLEELIDNEHITFYTKNGSRKRFFVLNNGYMKKHLKELELEWKKRNELYEEIAVYHKVSIQKGEDKEGNFDKKFLLNLIEYSNEIIQSLEKLQQKINTV